MRATSTDLKRIGLSIAVAGVLLFAGSVYAQGVPSDMAKDSEGHTAHEEAEGKIVWEKLQAQQTTYADLSDEDFAVLGEYFMGQMIGASHEAMNTMMQRMMGEQGEEQIHIVMGKRLSGCDASAGSIGFVPMMHMMGGWSSPTGFNQSNYPMMWGSDFMGWGFGGLGWIFMILWWVLIIAGIVALTKWLANQSRGGHDHKTSALETLKERYARGEIERKEFEEKKKDLV